MLSDKELLTIAVEVSGLSESVIEKMLSHPSFNKMEGWSFFIPDPLRELWAELPFNMKVAMYLVGDMADHLGSN
jgi:hypothetical protein